jgi:hypothetical protein
MATPLLVVSVLLAAAVVGLILFANYLHTQLRAARNQIKDLADQLGHRTKKAVDSSRAVHVAKAGEMFAPI